MNNSKEFPDDSISDFVKANARKYPNKNFEIQMMSMIYAEKKCKDEVCCRLKKSFHFFVSAILLGVGLMVVMILGKLNVNVDAKTFEVLALFVVLIIGMLNLDNYSRLIKKYSI